MPRPIVAACSLLVALGCASDSRVSEPDGTPEVWALGAEPQLVIGETDGDPHYLFQRIAAARLLPSGRIVVADRGASVVRFYDADGRFDLDVGRKGEGPGEFQRLATIDLHSQDTLAIYDLGLQRLTRFLADGTLVDTQPFLGEGGSPEVYLGRYSNGDIGLSWIEIGPRNASKVTPDIMHFGRFGQDGRLSGLIGTTSGLRRFETGPIPFTPHLHAFMIGDSVFATDGRRRQITVFGANGDTVRVFGLEDVPMDPGDAWASFEAEVRARGRGETLQRFESVPRDEPVPQVAEVLLDDRELFWLKKYDPRTDSYALGNWIGAPGGLWWIMDTGGRQVAAIDLPEDLIPLDVRADQLLGLTRDELGVERIVVYEITREFER